MVPEKSWEELSWNLEKKLGVLESCCQEASPGNWDHQRASFMGCF